MNKRGILMEHRALGAGKDGWYHLMPMGEHPGVLPAPDGKRQQITEVIDRQAIEAMIIRHNTRKAANADWPGYLVDIEHVSHKADGSTAAYAWGVELQDRTGEDVPEQERGIWVKLNKTQLGEGTIGSVYKYLSSVNLMEHISGDRWRPVSIEDIGLTNRPAYKTLVPAEHRDRNGEENSNMLERLRKLLAKHSVTLAEDAGEDAAVEALETVLHTASTQSAEALQQVETTRTKLETAEHRVAELETAQLEREADAFVAEHRDRFSDEVALKDLFMKHREAAQTMVGLIKVPETKPAEEKPAPRTLHRESARTPEQKESEAAEAARAAEQRAFVKQVAIQHRCSHVHAWTIAAEQRPELFAEATD